MEPQGPHHPRRPRAARSPPGWPACSTRRASIRPRSPGSSTPPPSSTNALIERKGAVTGLITTRGLRGHARDRGASGSNELYDLAITKPEPLVAAGSCGSRCPRRTKADGRIARRLDTRAVAARAAALARAGVEAIAVVFLHAYANPRHEREVARLIARRHPGIAGDNVARGGPPRSASTSGPRRPRWANCLHQAPRPEVPGPHGRAGVGARDPGPAAAHALERRPHPRGRGAQRVPVQMLESGPAAGAIAAAFFGQADGQRPGCSPSTWAGPTAKLSLVGTDGEPLTAYSFEAARQRRFIEGSGLPIRISTIELIEIGAGRRQHRGGGRDRAPQGGARAAPARTRGRPAYGWAWREPTVTDRRLSCSAT